MKLQDQVCTLEQGRRLKELGIDATPCLFIHVDRTHGHTYEGIKLKTECLSFKRIGKIVDAGIVVYVPAFTVAELGEMLPTLSILRYKSNNGRGNDYYWLDFKGEEWSDLNEASLLAKFVINLLEQKVITSKKVNEVLLK